MTRSKHTARRVIAAASEEEDEEDEEDDDEDDEEDDERGDRSARRSRQTDSLIRRKHSYFYRTKTITRT
jgi:TATA-binding protein-associated factor Taf7